MTGRSLVPMKRPKTAIAKRDNRIPDEVWEKLQQCGEEATDHLLRILQSPGFEKRKIHEQIRVIELALLRSYGAPELAPERSKTPDRGNEQQRAEQGNRLAELAKRAKLPELQRSDAVFRRNRN